MALAEDGYATGKLPRRDARGTRSRGRLRYDSIRFGLSVSPGLA